MGKEATNIVNVDEVNHNYHITVLILCFTCIVIYIYLYSSIAFKSEVVSVFMKDAIDDLDVLKNKLELQLKSLMVNQQLNERTEITRNTTLTRPNLSQNFKSTFPLLTIFTTFSSSAEKYVCRNNTIRNWMSFGTIVKPIFFSDDADLLNKIKSKGWDVQRPSKTAIGIPILKYMYLDAMKTYRSKFYAYVNGDILFTQSLIDTLRFIASSSKINQAHPMLIVGQRTNVKNVGEEDASTHESIMKISKTGKLFTECGEDYFITNANYPWHDCPEVVIGRVAYDNWLVMNANKRRHTTLDATRTLLALHQTTRKGDNEGHAHPNRDFNGNLLKKLYKKINYGSGLTSCTRKYTAINNLYNQIEILDRPGC